MSNSKPMYISVRVIYEGCSDTSHYLLDVKALENSGVDVAERMGKSFRDAKNPADMDILFGYSDKNPFHYDDWDEVCEILHDCWAEPPQMVRGLATFWVGG